MARAPTKPCVDCVEQGITTKRKTRPPGPRCHSHHLARRKDRRSYSHEKHIMDLYGLTKDEYQDIYEFQGGKCAICQRATGARRRLSVDHCHDTGEVRGELCSTCNKMLGHARDDPMFFRRAIDYLHSPPARNIIGIRIVPEGGAPVKNRRENA